jgi:hypothetical protein
MPGKVHAIAIMTLVGGIWALANALIVGVLLGISTCAVGCLWPGIYYGIVLGILATIKGSQLMSKDARQQPPPRWVAIMQIINIVNVDVPNCVMGILTLVFLQDAEVLHYYRND